MTPARKAALQWFHDRGEVSLMVAQTASGGTTSDMRKKMMRDGQLERRRSRLHGWVYTLTDKGRRDLHEAGR